MLELPRGLVPPMVTSTPVALPQPLQQPAPRGAELRRPPAQGIRASQQTRNPRSLSRRRSY
ncbi:hypothetical protein ACFQ08_18295 [Streptosporangium algeriense]|uniref:Uncharacterized protein n=1 Tax=Streptosporangium algeriense TaxID=1682748 RepID=A0ABW3DTI5_9ACTN